MNEGSRNAAAVCLLWAGLVAGISFIEAPAKFGAVTLTYPVALDVGRTVFAASHTVQLGFAMVLLLLLAVSRARGAAWIVCVGIFVALGLQQLWLLPALGERARVIIAGGDPPGSSPHAIYGALEVAKFLGLLAASSLLGRAAKSVPAPTRGPL